MTVLEDHQEVGKMHPFFKGVMIAGSVLAVTGATPLVTFGMTGQTITPEMWDKFGGLTVGGIAAVVIFGLIGLILRPEGKKA